MIQRNDTSELRRELQLQKALEEAKAQGWIESIWDWRADLECFGSHDTYQYRCGECPLSSHCEETFQESQIEEDEYVRCEGIQEIGKKFGLNRYNRKIYIEGYESTGKAWRVWGSGKTFHGVDYSYWQIWIPKSISMLLWDTPYRNQIVIPNWFYEKSMKVYFRKPEDR